MNREIKFRAWDKKNKRMVEPALKLNADGTITLHNIFNALELPSHSSYEQFIWLQYTGLKDKNGKGIYESDIVREIYKDDKIGKTYIVTFSDGSTRYSPINDISKWHGQLNKIQCKIIGNIYENPEMLKEN